MDSKDEYELILKPLSVVEGPVDEDLIHRTYKETLFVPKSLGALSGKIGITTARTVLDILLDSKSSHVTHVVSLTKNNMPPNTREFRGSYGTEVCIPEFADGTQIPVDTFQVIADSAARIAQYAREGSDKQIIFCCDSGQSRSISCAIVCLYMAINNLLQDDVTYGLDEWRDMSTKDRLVASALFVNSARMAGMPAHAVWNSLLSHLMKQQNSLGGESASLADLHLMDGKDAHLINFVFIKSRAKVHHRVAELTADRPRSRRERGMEV